jgi:hypothetical protein
MELLIAVVAFALVLAAINGVFYSAVRLRNKTMESFDEAVPLQHTLTILKRDLANLVAPGGTLSGTLQTTPTAGLNSQSAGAMSSLATASLPGLSSPDFYTSTGVIDETSPWAEVQKVSYSLASSTNGAFGKDLIRSVTRNLLPSLQEQPVLQPLMSGVESMGFLYYDGSQWRDTWDSAAEQTPLPKAIKVQIALAVEEKGRSQPPPIELVVPLLVEGNTNQTAQATGGGP